MYCKCGDMVSARHLFDVMPKRDVVSWNSIVSGYFQIGLCYDSIDVFIMMRHCDVVLDKFSYASALSVCARMRELNVGKLVHGLIVVCGLSKLAFLTNSLMDMYSKCGDLDGARRVFDSSDELDDVSWNSLISALVRVGLIEETQRVFARMHQAGMKMNSFALGSVLKACSSFAGSKELGRVIHGCVVRVGLDSDVFVGSAMLDLYAKKGLLDEAVKVFKLMPDPNVVVFNAMIAGFSRMDTEIDNIVTCEALHLFCEMLRRGMPPSKFTFSSILRACNLTESFELGKQIHGLIFKYHLQYEEFIGSALIDLYSKAHSIEDGFRYFLSSPKQDIVTWTSMISACVENEQFERALSMFNELLNLGRKPDQFTISSVMSACANLAVARSGEQIQSYATKSGFSAFTICANAQIFMYAGSGDIDAADQTFKEMQTCDVVSWSAMISSHAKHGCATDALLLFQEMEHRKVFPNHITFLGVLTACSHGGLVDEGFRYFESMQKEYGIHPNVKHCACMVDLLGRAGRLTDAENFISESGFSDDPVLWRALLSSCRIHKDTETGARVAERVIELDPSASASYVLLYNMYLDAGNESLALRTRDLMKEHGVKKEPGLSWIEIGGSVHSFVVGDKSHPKSDAIYSKLNEMLSRIERVDDHKADTLEFEDIQLEHKESMFNCHSEKLAVALGVLLLPKSAPIRVMKNLRICADCHTTMKLFSRNERREIVVRDAIRFHRFRNGSCSCKDYW
ncbi:TPR-like protein [Dioscorea alata]|uniref:TPR-like protein n=1 Tax=Dioscorea alata TaxID=55571 RepID=A0ACB7W064_DIOAL|nr:TPR-like protein [Dioscorea alata]